MDGYRIEKARYPVLVRTVDGASLPGDMFVQAHAPFSEGAETPSHILNDADPFFPLGMGEHDVVLVAKEHVLEVETRLDVNGAEELLLAVSRPVVVEVTLVDGAVRAGALHLEVSANRPRLIDFLNRIETRFVLLQSTDGARLINRRCIVRVRPLD